MAASAGLTSNSVQAQKHSTAAFITTTNNTLISDTSTDTCKGDINASKEILEFVVEEFVVE